MYLFLINERQLNLLKGVNRRLIEAINAYKKTEDLTIFISYLYLAQRGFSSLVRPNDRDEILNKIFKGFCVGK
jgi:tRNA U34 5-carboxymethylaminomethyl modifying GTPase MnmE/TrmE